MIAVENCGFEKIEMTVGNPRITNEKLKYLRFYELELRKIFVLHRFCRKIKN